jgi:zinc/manganese transport system substrate-binding protein
MAAPVSRVRAQNSGFSLMKTIAGLGLSALLAFVAPPSARAADGKIAVVAAENFYGDIARQIGGDRVTVVSIMNSPDQDPHLFETTPGIVRQIADAQITIFNGADYDVAALTRHQAGDNPHLWYDPSIMLAVARLLDADLAKADRTHSKDYDARLAAFEASLKPLIDKIAALRGKYAGTPVTASEPVFGHMAQALGLTMHNERFQLSIMNDTEPSARDVAAFEQDLKEHKVRVMFYNKQASSKIVQRLVELARAAKIPVVGVTETAPPGLSYQDWMLTQLNDVEKALAGPSS